MDFKSFSSDTTYYSLYENSKRDIRKCRTINKLNDSEFLDKVHDEVISHLEGKRLMGRVEVIQYMKKLSKMNLKNPRDQCFAKKIQSGLLKIYNLTKQFQETLMYPNASPLLDPMESSITTQDFRIFNAENEDPKQILLRSTSVNDNISSFPFEMLSNNNFISSSHQNKVELNNSNITSEISEAYIKTLSTSENISTQDTQISNFKETVTSSINCAVDCKEHKLHETLIDINPYDNNLHNSNGKDYAENKSATENLIDTADSEECNIIQQLSNLCGNLSIVQQSNISTISETVNLNSEDLPISVKNLNLKTVTDLGKNLHTNEMWSEIESNLTSGEFLAEKVHSTLENWFDKLHPEEFGTNSMQHITTTAKKDFHNFSEDDDKKLFMEDLMSTNLNRLKQIYDEFRIFVNSKLKDTEKHNEI